MVDTDDTRQTTYDGRWTTDDRQRQGYDIKLPTGELKKGSFTYFFSYIPFFEVRQKITKIQCSCNILNFNQFRPNFFSLNFKVFFQ